MKPPDQESSAPPPSGQPPDPDEEWDPTAEPLPPAGSSERPPSSPSPADPESPPSPMAPDTGSQFTDEPEPPLPPVAGRPAPPLTDEPLPPPPSAVDPDTGSQFTDEPEPPLPPAAEEPARPLAVEAEAPLPSARGPEPFGDGQVESSDAENPEQDFDGTQDEAPLERRQGGKRVVAFVLAALLVIGAASSLQFFFQGGEEAEGGSWRWSRLPFPPIDPRYGHAAVWTGSKMIVWGGFSGVAAEAGLPGAGIRADGAEFAPETGDWEIVPAAPVAHRPDIPAVWTGSEMIAWGGDPAQPALGAAYNPDTNSWRALPPSPLPARGGQGAVWTGAEVIMWGGRVSPADRPAEPPVLSAAGAAYNPATDSWRDIPPAPIPPRDGHSTVWTGKEMIAWGGTGDPPPEGSARLLDGAAFDPAANSWRAIAAAPSSAESKASWSGREMLVWGSRAERVTPQASPAATPQISPAPESSPTASPRPAIRFVVEALAYNPATNRWRKLPTPPLSARTDAAAVWSGARFIAWGGLVRRADSRLSDPAADGAAYDPGSNEWQMLPEAPIPGRDTGFSMVPTPDGVIVWGGKATEPGSSGRTLADGARLTGAEG